MPPARRASPGTRQHNGSMSAFARSRAGLSRPASAARSSPEHAAWALTGLVQGEAVDPRDAVATNDRVPPPLARCRAAQRHVPKQAQRDAIERQASRPLAEVRSRRPRQAAVELHLVVRLVAGSAAAPRPAPHMQQPAKLEAQLQGASKALRAPSPRRGLCAALPPRPVAESAGAALSPPRRGVRIAAARVFLVRLQILTPQPCRAPWPWTLARENASAMSRAVK